VIELAYPGPLRLSELPTFESRREWRRPAILRSLFERIRHSEEVRFPERSRHELDADRQVADKSARDGQCGKAKNGAQPPIVPEARSIGHDGLGHDIVGDDSGQVIERRIN
jgi:hypothetical protein